MRRLNSDQDDDDECNVVDYTSPNLDEVCVHFAEHNLIPFEELRSECERDEWAKRIIRRVIHGNWKACTHNCRRWFWLDRSVHMRRRPWEKVILFMPAICGRFGVPRTLVSNNFKEFINNEVVTRSHA